VTDRSESRSAAEDRSDQPASITDPPPPAAQADLDRLRAALDERIPARQLDANLLVGTWNLRAFGGLTERWEAAEGDEPQRDLHALRCIAEIVSRFDVVAIQEVREDIKALRHMLRSLGDHWGLILTDVTKGDAGNRERMAFVFDTRRVRPSGLACELVLPPMAGHTDTAGALDQFARTPYAVSFLATGRGYRQTFVLVTLHVIWGKKPKRKAELSALAEWAAGMARQMDEYNQNLIVLGDFNIDKQGDPLYEAFRSTGLRVPDALCGFSRTLPSGKKVNFYDQIAWFTGDNDVPALSLKYSGKGGNLDFFNVVYQDLDVEPLSWKMSDHYPLWVEFLTK
jgi:endonuclease/exonuclease/phosphatase family metal-dependent hydrolase